MTSSEKIGVCLRFLLLLSLLTCAMTDGSVDCRQYGLPGLVFVDWRMPAAGKYELHGQDEVYVHGTETNKFVLSKSKYWNIEELTDGKRNAIARTKDERLTEMPLNEPHVWDPDEILLYCPVKCSSRVHIYYKPCLNATGTYVAESYLNESNNSQYNEGNWSRQQDTNSSEESEYISYSEEIDASQTDVWRPMTYTSILGDWKLTVNPMYLYWTFGQGNNVLGFHTSAPCPGNLKTTSWLIYDTRANDLLPNDKSLFMFIPDTCGCGARRIFYKSCSQNYDYYEDYDICQDYYYQEYSGLYLYKNYSTWVHESGIATIVLERMYWILMGSFGEQPISNATTCLEHIKNEDHRFYCEQELKVSSRIVVTYNGKNSTLYKTSVFNHRPAYSLSPNRSDTRVLFHKTSQSGKKGFWVLSDVCKRVCKKPDCKENIIRYPSWDFKPYPLEKKDCSIDEDKNGELVKISQYATSQQCNQETSTQHT